MVMETITQRNGTQSFQPMEALPADRGQWPADAGKAYNHLLRELNQWSREHDCPMTTNSWIAEEAVRQAW
jgi:hypothetical protein